ncbi:MAG TPA: TlpA disulfide reductase family protein, partial [Candidatus Binataceae bacterium]
MNTRVLYAVAAIALVVGLSIMIVGRSRHAPATSQEIHEGSDSAPVPAGDRAADFKLKTLDGTTLSLNSLRGKVVFLNVWATWCGPCREEMPSMETLYDEFKRNKDFVMLAVSQDT